MKRVHNHLASAIAIFIICLFICNDSFASSPQRSHLNVTYIESSLGMKGKLNAKDQTYRITVPRSDLKISANGIQMQPDMGLISWVVFKKVDDKTLLLGDLILTPDQISPIMGIALDHGLEVTSLRNNYLWDSPQVVTMHIEAKGKEAQLADAVRQIFDSIHTTAEGNGDFPIAVLDPTQSTLDPSTINSVLGRKGTYKDGIYKVTVNEIAETDDYEISGSMGLSSWATFIGSNKEAVVNGDLVIEQSNLQKILMSLHKADMYVVGIQEHTADSEPKFVSVKFLGVGNTAHLAKSLRSVLDIQKSTIE